MASRKNEYVVAKDRIKVSVGDVIKEMCELNELSQTELAKRAGIQGSNLSLIIKGKRSIGKAVAEKLAKVLNVSPSFILFAGESPRQGSDIGGAIDASLLKCAIKTVEDNKNKDMYVQLDAMRIAIECIVKALLSTSTSKLAPVDLIVHTAKHSSAGHIKRRH